MQRASKVTVVTVLLVGVVIGALWGRSSLTRVEYVPGPPVEERVLVVPDVPPTVTETVTVTDHTPTDDCVVWLDLNAKVLAATEQLSAAQGAIAGVVSDSIENKFEQSGEADVQLREDAASIDTQVLAAYQAIGQNKYKMSQLGDPCR